jgi:hypothetical protein
MPRALWAKAPLALLRHPVGLLAVVCAAFLVAIGAASGTLMNAGAESEALQSKLQVLTPLAAGLVIDRPLGIDSGDLRAADERRRAAAVALGRTLPSVRAPLIATTSYGQLIGPAPVIGNPLLVVLMARTGATAHVQRLAGSAGEPGVWLSRATVVTAGLHAGGRVTFVPPFPAPPGAHRITLPLAAVYRPLDTDLANPYWVNFTARIRARNPDSPPPPTFALVPRSQIYRLAHEVGGNALANVYEFPLDPRAMTPGRAKKIARAFQDVECSLGTRSALAKSLGCEGAYSRCRVSSELTDAVRTAAAGNSGLRPVIDLLATFCVLIALGAALITGVFTGRRRAAEARLSLVGGEPRSLFMARAALEAFLPAVFGAAAGFAIAVELVRLFTPQGSVDAGVVRQAAARVALSVVGSVLAVAVGVVIARGRLGGGRSAWRGAARVPWEVAGIAAAAAAWIVLLSGGGLVKDPVAGSHPRLAVLLLPALVAAPLTGIATRVLRSLVLRRVAVAPVAAFLALRRVAAARGLVVALTVTVAAGLASLAFAETLRSSLAASTTEKALVSNGSDVQGNIDPARTLPRSFPYPVTKVAEVFDAGLLGSGKPFEVITVDPPSLERVLASHWSREVRSKVRALAKSDAPLPALAVGVRPGRQVVTLGGSRAVVDVVARLRAFPGMQPSMPLLVVPVRALATPPAQALTYVWATGPPAKVEAALLQSTLSPVYLTAVAEFSRNPEVLNITRTYGFLRIVALALVGLALVALMLYLSGRERSQLVTAAFLRRMGVSQSRQAASVALESSFLVAVATVVGFGAAFVTAGAIVGHVDPLAQYSPVPVVVVPWQLLIASGVGVIVIAGVVGAVLTLLVRRSGIGEDLRVS